MRAGKRLNTETRQTRSCNVVLKNIETVEKRNPSRNSKLIANAALLKRTTGATPPSKPEPQNSKNKATSKITTTTTTPVQSKPEKSTGAALNRRKSVHNSNLTSKLAAVEVRVSRLRRSSLPAATHLLKKEIAARTAKATKPLNSSTNAKAEKSKESSLKLVLSDKRNESISISKITTPSRSRSCSPLITTEQQTTVAGSGSAKEKMYKQTKLIAAAASVQSTPTIAASRSRRAIKPNPKYASEDIVTPKYVTSLANDSSFIASQKKTANSARITERGRAEFFSKNLDDDFMNEDDDDDITDAAFDPRTQNSDDDEELSDFESYRNVAPKPKAPQQPQVVKRGRGRPSAASKNMLAATPKFSGTPGRPQVTSTSTVTSGQKAGFKAAPTQLQKLRRTMSMGVPSVTANQVAANKRKLYMEDDDEEDDDDDDDGDEDLTAANQSARKRILVTTSTGANVARPAAGATPSADNKKVGVRRSMPMVNGANKSVVSSTSSASKIQVTRTQPNAASSSTPAASRETTATKLSKATTYQRAAAIKTTEKTGTVSSQRIGPAQTRAAKQTTTTAPTAIKSSTAASGAVANAAMKHEVKCSPDDTHTFTIINIDAIVNQDDVLISTTAAQTARTSSANTKSSSSDNNKSSTAVNSSNNNNAARYNNATNAASSMANKRQIFSKKLPAGAAAAPGASVATSTTAAVKVGNATVSSKLNSASRPAPRILNTEAGKKTQSMKPLMNMVDDMVKDIRPVGYDDEDDDFELDDDLYTQNYAAPTKTTIQRAKPSVPVGSVRQQRMPPRRTFYSNTSSSNRNTTNNNNNTNTKTSSATNVMSAYNQKRRLASLLGDDEPLNVRPPPPTFKKPILSSSSTTAATTAAAAKTTTTTTKPDAKENSLAATNQRTMLSVSKVMKTTTPAPPQPVVTLLKTSPPPSKMMTTHGKPLLTLPPETTTIRCEGGRVIRKITCYENWYVITEPKKLPHVKQNFLEIPLMRLANVANRIKTPSSLWSSKVTLYKLSPAALTKQTNLIYTGDLRMHNITEADRHKYQPSCVLFRRARVESDEHSVPYDRAVIFKNKSFYINIDGKHVNLIGAPDVISTGKDIETFLNIVDELTLESSLVEVITTAK